MKTLTTEQKEQLGIKRFDVAEYLDNDEMIALYLADALENGTDEDFIQALNTVARAKGMNEIAQKAGLGRESLYQTLSSKQPRFSTIKKILGAFNLQLTPTIKTS